MESKLFLAIVITVLLAVISGMNAFQPSTSAGFTEQLPISQKLSFQFFRPAPSYSDTVR